MWSAQLCAQDPAPVSGFSSPSLASAGSFASATLHTRSLHRHIHLRTATAMRIANCSCLWKHLGRLSRLRHAAPDIRRTTTSCSTSDMTSTTQSPNKKSIAATSSCWSASIGLWCSCPKTWTSVPPLLFLFSSSTSVVVASHARYNLFFFEKKPKYLQSRNCWKGTKLQKKKGKSASTCRLGTSWKKYQDRVLSCHMYLREVPVKVLCARKLSRSSDRLGEGVRHLATRSLALHVSTPFPRPSAKSAPTFLAESMLPMPSCTSSPRS